MPIPAQAVVRGDTAQVGSLFFPVAPRGYVGDFNRATRQALVTLPGMSPPSAGTAGQISRQNLPTTGFLGGIWLILEGTTTTAANSTATAAANMYPITPTGFLRRIRLYNNQNVEVFNLSGYSAYVYGRTLRTGFDLFDTSGFREYNNDPVQRFIKSPISLPQNSSDTWRMAWPVWSAWGWSLQASLLLLQDPAITYTLEVTWGDTTDLYNATTGTVTLSSITLTPVVEIYAVPQFADDFPMLSFTKTVTEELQPLTAGTGDNVFRLVTGNQVTRLMHEVVNNGAPVPPANVTNVQLGYAQTQIPYSYPADQVLARQAWMYGQVLPEGWYCHELSNALGLPELVSTRDIINTARVTDLFSAVRLSGVTVSGTNFLRTVKEQLVANR